MQECKYVAAGLLAHALAAVLQLPEKDASPVDLVNLGQQIRAESQRAGYKLIRTGRQLIKQRQGGDRDE